MTLSSDALESSFAAAPVGRPRRRHGFTRKLVHGQLDRLDAAQLTLVDVQRDSSRTFGPGDDPSLCATARILDGALYSAMAARGSVGVADSWVDGHWTSEDLTAVVRVFVRNRHILNGMETGLARLGQAPLKLLHRFNSNTVRGARRNISAHYDLGNDFFEQMLDPTMTYSCGVFETPDATVEEAQIAKLERLCRKLDLQPTDHLLEVGTGWGSLAIHAARHHGCRVTTTTISAEQHAVAAQRIAAAGLGDRITLLLQDYRGLEGQFDKLVSCEMIEAVGAPFLQSYLGKCASLLKPDGLMALQAILIADQEYERALREVDFIKRYIFPGSFIPSMTAILDAATRGSDLRLASFEEIGPHYATTLRRWREQLEANRSTVLDLGYDERFLRLWEFYLCYCEGGFAERFLGVGHIVLSKPSARADHLVA